MFENVYTNGKAKGEEQKAENIVKELFLYYMEHPELLEAAKEEFLAQTKDQPYISSLPDDYHPF